METIANASGSSRRASRMLLASRKQLWAMALPAISAEGLRDMRPILSTALKDLRSASRGIIDSSGIL
ncbi:MAG: hypothetical protein QM688_06870 [Sphingomonas bacterium]